MLIIPEKLTFLTVKSIKAPIEDAYSKWNLDQLLAAISTKIIEEIEEIWEQRNQIDYANDRPFPIMDFNRKSLIMVIRWYLRGLPLDLAIRKVRTETYFYMQLLQTWRIKAEKMNRVVNGFRHGDRVVLCEPKYGRRNIVGAEGTVWQCRTDYCLVQFDFHPTNQGGLKLYQVPYEYLWNPSQRKTREKTPPKLVSKRVQKKKRRDSLYREKCKAQKQKHKAQNLTPV